MHAIWALPAGILQRHRSLLLLVDDMQSSLEGFDHRLLHPFTLHRSTASICDVLSDQLNLKSKYPKYPMEPIHKLWHIISLRLEILMCFCQCLLAFACGTHRTVQTHYEH